ncbi:MAG: hypothetical protein QXF57_03885 [Acidilobaceae archaeon]
MGGRRGLLREPCSHAPRLALSLILLLAATSALIVLSTLELWVRVVPGIALEASPIVCYILAFAASLALLLLTGSIVASTSFLVFSLVLMDLSLAVFALLALLSASTLWAVSRLRRFSHEPLLDTLTLDISKWSPTALASAALTFYLSRTLLEWSLEPWEDAVYSLAVAASALLASASSSSLAESLTLGVVSALGPLGLAITSTRLSLKPLRVDSCEGVFVGELIAIEARVSTSRGLIPYHSGASRVLACTERSRATLKLSEPWILWGYGSLARAVALERVMPGSRAILSLCREGPRVSDIEKALEEAMARRRDERDIVVDLGSLNPVEIRVAYALSVARELAERGVARVVVIDASECFVPRERLEDIVSEAPRFARSLVILLSDLPWGAQRLAPRGSATSSGFIACGLQDLAEARSIASILAPEAAEDLARLLLEGRLCIGYPGCRGELVVFRA